MSPQRGSSLSGTTIHPAGGGNEGFLQPFNKALRGRNEVEVQAPDYVPNRHRGQHSYKKQALSIMPLSPIQGYRSADHFTPLILLIDEVFNTFKDQSCVRRPKPIQPNPSLIGSEEYCSFYDRKGYQIIHCWALRRI